MSQSVDLDKTVYETLKEHPDLMPILVELGFTPLANKAMLQTAGRMTSLRKGSKLIGIPIEKIIQTLEWNGYEVVLNDDEHTV